MTKKRSTEKSTAKTARITIASQNVRVQNLKNITRAIPRDRLVVVTGLSGSGK